jgi:hypothetical protein
LHYNATEYLSGNGGKKYLDLISFKNKGIKVSFQDNLIKKPLFEAVTDLP